MILHHNKKWLRLISKIVATFLYFHYLMLESKDNKFSFNQCYLFDSYNPTKFGLMSVHGMRETLLF